MIQNYLLIHPFIGRTRELADVQTRLENPECRLLTVTGLGGSGKTRLAIEAAQAVIEAFPEGIVFVGLQSLTRSDLLVTTIAHAVGLTFYGKAEPEVQLFNFLREKSMLLLMDNFEHLLDGAALISAILARTSGVKILVTSREALNLQEEWIYPLMGMATPPSIYSETLEDYESVQLFLYHAQRIQPKLDLTLEHDAIVYICKMTAGLPLAIALAASWLKGLTPSQIAREMQHNLDFLVTSTRNVEERHRSMRAVFDQSWKLLAENERLIFARLSVFRSGFDQEAAKQVTGASLTVLAALVEKSLLQMETSSRFSIHELLRQYGMEKLDEYGEMEITYEKHSQYYAQLMLRHEATLKQPEQLAAMQAIDIDFENFSLAWHWSSKNQRTEFLHDMLNGLYLFGFVRSRYRETVSLFQYALEQSVSDKVLLGKLLARRWGYLHWWFLADYQEAFNGIQYALTTAQAENDTFETAFCHLMMAYTKISMQRYENALSHLESSKALFEAINEPYYVCWVLHRLGYTYSNLKKDDIANHYTEQSLALARVTYNRLALVICLYNLGSDYILKRDYVKGRLYCAEALQVATESGHRGQIAHALSLLALSAFCEEDFDTARTLAEKSYFIIEDIDLLVFQPYNLALLILLACLYEDYSEGIRLNDLGSHQNTNVMGYQLLYWSLSVLACGLGDPTETRRYIQKALEITDIDTDPALSVWVAPGTAYILAETDAQKAVQLLAWIFSFPDTALNWARRWPLLKRLQTQLQANIADYQVHWEKGKTLTLDAVDTLLQEIFQASDKDSRLNESLLTARESEVLSLMATGLTNQQIAEKLVIGVGTVKTHTLNIYRKLDVANRTQAIVRAQELGLFPV